MTDETRILAIDFGLRRIGIALSDPLKIFAYPFKTLRNDNVFFDELKKIFVEQKIEKVILGIPGSDNKSTNDLKNKINSLKDKIEKTGLVVITWDESFTSLIAGEKILESVTKKSKRRDKSLLDQHSAAIILQEYLNSIRVE
ncbi:MAG: Holliday junction resolvase RuvX [Ignavibacteriales bacterium]|nr:MAG: Holliday junction resolvase RuvX [Ignavibacteriales bacterium]